MIGRRGFEHVLQIRNFSIQKLDWKFIFFFSVRLAKYWSTVDLFWSWRRQKLDRSHPKLCVYLWKRFRRLCSIFCRRTWQWMMI
jgi:hypothetical protein